MEGNIINFSGTNEKLFSRVVLDEINVKMSLIVPETHNAILVKDGQMLQTLSSGKYFLSQFVDVKTETNSSLEILYMSKTAKLKLLWGTAAKILMYDANIQENYKIGLSGDFEVQISDPRKAYLYLVGVSQDLTADALQERLMSTVVSVLETALMDYVEQNKISYSKLSQCKQEISAQTLKKLSHKLNSEYGIAVFSFNIANIIIDEEDLKRMSLVLKSNNPDLMCKNCGETLSNGAKFCPSCGKKVGGGKTCIKCFAENEERAKFCCECGNAF